MPRQQHIRVEHPERRQTAHAPGLVVVEQSGQQLRALTRGHRVPGDQCVAADQHPVHDVGAVPARVSGGWDRHGSARQRGRDFLGERMRGGYALPRQRALEADLRGPLHVARLPHPGRQIEKRHLLEVLAVRVTDLVGVAEHRRAMGFREPDGGAEVIDVGVGQQERVDVVDSETQRADRFEHVVALPREPGVDDQQPCVIDDERPVHQLGLREVDGLGDLLQLHRRTHGDQSRCRNRSSRRRLDSRSGNSRPGLGGRT